MPAAYGSIKTAVGHDMRFGSHKALLGAGAAGFNPASIWTGGAAGMWLDQSDAATGYQDSQGFASNVLNSPIGLRLDKRLGLALGAETCTDPGMDTPAAWATSAGWAVTGSKGVATAAGIGSFLWQNLAAITVGSYWQITADVVVTAGSVFFFAGSSAPASPVITVSGTYTYRVAAIGSGQIGFGVPASGFTGTVDNVSFKLVTGNHVLQATAAARPTWKLNGAIYSDLTDGVDDKYTTATFAAGTLINGMDCFVAIKRAAATGFVLVSSASGSLPYFGAAASGSGVTAHSVNTGSPTYEVNGVAVPGGSATTEGQLHTATTVGSWVVLGVLGLDLSTWTALNLGFYSGAYPSNEDIGGVILCPAQSAANRNNIRTWLGNKVGLVL